MDDTRALRTPDLAWSHAAAAGQLDGLRWVERGFDRDEREKGRRLPPENGHPRFQQRSYGQLLPPPIAEAIMDAQAEGFITAWEVLLMLFARPEWMVAARKQVWAPWSFTPLLLAQLVEAFGVESSLHRNDPECLARLVALLPRWHPHRGTVERAEEILDAAGEAPQVRGVYSGAAAEEQITSEAFTCRGEDWWVSRSRDGQAAYRIEGGVLRHQPTDGAAFPPQREDILLHVQEGEPLPLDLLRLLPAWTVVRPVVSDPAQGGDASGI